MLRRTAALLALVTLTPIPASEPYGSTREDESAVDYPPARPEPASSGE